MHVSYSIITNSSKKDFMKIALIERSSKRFASNWNNLISEYFKIGLFAIYHAIKVENYFKLYSSCAVVLYRVSRVSRVHFITVWRLDTWKSE